MSDFQDFGGKSDYVAFPRPMYQELASYKAGKPLRERLGAEPLQQPAEKTEESTSSDQPPHDRN